MFLSVNGELAQLIALATHGSIWLRTAGADGAPPDLASNSTFKYVRSAEFMARSDGSVATVDGWLCGLRSGGVPRLWLAVPATLPVRSRWPHLEPHTEVAFANGGHWFLLANVPGAAAQAWHATWTVIEPRPADNRIWMVRYEAEPATGIEAQRMPLGTASAALNAALREARDLATRLGEPEWTAQFDSALNAASAEPPHHQDMVHRAFPEDARRLLAKASRAWVFGGMGSWNDLSIDNDAKRAEHAEISRLLFGALLQGCVAAVNCPLPDEAS